MSRDAWLAIGVDLYLLTTAEGGRSKPIGIADDYKDFQYRPNWGLPSMTGTDQAGAPVLCFERFPVELGNTVRAVIVPPFPRTLPEWHRVSPNDELRMFEGPRVCGRAVVRWMAPTSLPVGEAERDRFCAWATRNAAAPRA